MNRIVQAVRVQAASGASATTAAIVTTTGNSVVAIAVCFGNHLGALSDSASNTWASAIASTGTTKGWALMGYVHNMTGSATHTFTISSNGTNDFFALYVWEVQGLQNAAPNHTSATNASSTTHSSGSITADAGVDEYHFGGGALSAAAELTPTVTSVEHAWSSRSLNATAALEGIVAGVAMVPAGNSTNYTYTTSNTQNETALIAGFKLSAGGGSGGPWTAAYAG